MPLNLIKIRLFALLFSSLIYMGAAQANTNNCKVSIRLDADVWSPQKEKAPVAAFFIAHPGEVASNIVTTYSYKNPDSMQPMQASFTCSKATYLEIHIIDLDDMNSSMNSSMNIETPPSTEGKNNLQAWGRNNYRYWSKCFGDNDMHDLYQDGRKDNKMDFPALDGTHSGHTHKEYMYENGPPTCHFLYQYSP